jgi:hypothetical protein
MNLKRTRNDEEKIEKKKIKPNECIIIEIDSEDDNSFSQPEKKNICGFFLIQIHPSETCELEGEFLCEECHEIFCENCFQNRHQSEARKNHVKIELNEPVKSLNCSKHKNEKIKFYCMKDKVDCCSICVISDHHGHKVEENSKLKNLKQEMKVLKSITSDLNAKLIEIDQTIKTNEEELAEKEILKDLEKIKEEHELKFKRLNEYKEKIQEEKEENQRKSESMQIEQSISAIMDWKDSIKNMPNSTYTIFRITEGKDVKEIPIPIKKNINQFSIGGIYGFFLCGDVLYKSTIFTEPPRRSASLKKFSIENFFCGEFNSIIICSNLTFNLKFSRKWKSFFDRKQKFQGFYR